MAQTELQLIGNVRRGELASIGSYRTTQSKPYEKGHPYTKSEGPNADIHGKDPITNPQNYDEAYKTVGDKNDITARNLGPGKLSQNQYKFSNPYDYSDVDL
jgi:hypothetical protein